MRAVPSPRLNPSLSAACCTKNNITGTRHEICVHDLQKPKPFHSTTAKPNSPISTRMSLSHITPSIRYRASKHRNITQRNGMLGQKPQHQYINWHQHPTSPDPTPGCQNETQGGECEPPNVAGLKRDERRVIGGDGEFGFCCIRFCRMKLVNMV